MKNARPVVSRPLDYQLYQDIAPLETTTPGIHFLWLYQLPRALLLAAVFQRTFADFPQQLGCRRRASQSAGFLRVRSLSLCLSLFPFLFSLSFCSCLFPFLRFLFFFLPCFLKSFSFNFFFSLSLSHFIIFLFLSFFPIYFIFSFYFCLLSFLTSLFSAFLIPSLPSPSLISSAALLI